MRSWTILLETIFAIILLTSAYLYLSENLRFYRKYNLDIDNFKYFRSFSQTCVKNYVYTVYFPEENASMVCINGKLGTIEDLENHTIISTYLFSGDKYYRPFILSIYS